jgi:hypothetical protein
VGGTRSLASPAADDFWDERLPTQACKLAKGLPPAFLPSLSKGAELLADPGQWAAHFGIPELETLPVADDLVIRKPHRADKLRAAPACW